METYPLLITSWGQFTCRAVSTADYGDGIDEHHCPSFDTPQEVADWIKENIE